MTSLRDIVSNLSIPLNVHIISVGAETHGSVVGPTLRFNAVAPDRDPCKNISDNNIDRANPHGVGTGSKGGINSTAEDLIPDGNCTSNLGSGIDNLSVCGGVTGVNIAKHASTCNLIPNNNSARITYVCGVGGGVTRTNN